ncbi:Aromatic/aminoadipate aminotransferase 1 [Dinochytrium kinnereticum]|nr:Aromatic/aminoadipate aminotransferase 1 [Dinochytrium kinnereticum]
MSAITLVGNVDLPKAKSFTHKLSKEAKMRKPSTLKSLYPIASRPGMIALAGGLPRHELFPFQTYSATILGKSGESSSVEIPTTNAEKGATSAMDSLQYLEAPGLKTLRDVVKKVFMPTGTMISDWDLMLTALEQMRPLGLFPIPVKMDGEGLIPSDIPRAVADFKAEKGEDARISMLYVVPTGQNPTGALMGVERRLELLKVASDLDLIVVEDDPYNALELPAYSPLSERSYRLKGAEGLTPSIFSLDTEGRVIYLYTFSKVITPGMRIGFAAASVELLTVLKFFQETSVMFASGFSQGLLLHLLNEWGPEGYTAHVKRLQDHYTIRRDWIIDACNRYLCPIDGHGPLVDYVIPEAGMFVWFKINLNDKHEKGAAKLIYERLIERSVLLANGDMFNPCEEQHGTTPFLRISFSYQSQENLETAVRVFGEVLREFNCGVPLSAKDFDQAVFDGTGISVFDLKREIIVNKKLGKGTDFDIAIYNAQTNEEYSDDGFIIPRNTSVLVNRNPASRPGKGTAQRYLTNSMPMAGSGRGRPFAAPTPISGSMPKHMTLVNNAQPVAKPAAAAPAANSADFESMTEEERIAAMFSTQDSQWQQEQEKMALQRPVARQWSGGGFRGRGGFNPGGPPRDAAQKPTTTTGSAPAAPASANTGGGDASPSSVAAASGDSGDGGYSKYGNFSNFPPRAPRPGHFINQCPTIGDKEFDRPKLKRTTGIPRIFLKPVDDKAAAGGGVMVTQNGELVVAAPNSVAWFKVAPSASSFVGVGDIYELAPILPEYECPWCHKNMKDPVTMPCCKTRYCDECVRERLLEHEDHSKRFRCPTCNANCTPDLLVADTTLRESIEKHLRDFATSSSNAPQGSVRSASASPIPPNATVNPTASTTSKASPRASPNPPETSSSAGPDGGGTPSSVPSQPARKVPPNRPYRIIESSSTRDGDSSSVNPGPGYVQKSSGYSIPVISLSEAERMGGGGRGPSLQPPQHLQQQRMRNGNMMHGGFPPGIVPPVLPGQNLPMMGGPGPVPNLMMGRPIHGMGQFGGVPPAFNGMMPPAGMPMGMGSVMPTGMGRVNGNMNGWGGNRRDDIKRKREMDVIEVGARDQRPRTSS